MLDIDIKSLPLFGDIIYSETSSLCKAAVYAGAITWHGGNATISVVDKQKSFASNVRNTVFSASLESSKPLRAFAVAVHECDPSKSGCNQNANCASKFGMNQCICNIGCACGLLLYLHHACPSVWPQHFFVCFRWVGPLSLVWPRYIGNGAKCLDLTKCAKASDCTNNADCANFVGDHKCRCKAGYTGSGKDARHDLGCCPSLWSRW